MISHDIVNLAEVLKITTNFAGTVDDIRDMVLEELADNIVQDARNNLQAHGNINSGELISSIRILDVDPGKGVTVGTDQPYAWYVEYGRGPVVPINSSVLHWIDKNTGKDVFSHKASATEPSPFLEPAVIKNTKKYDDLLVDRVEVKTLG